MAAVAVLRNDTLQAFLQVRQNFHILLEMWFAKLSVAGITRRNDAYSTYLSVSELRKLLLITRHYYFIPRTISD